MIAASATPAKHRTEYARIDAEIIDKIDIEAGAEWIGIRFSRRLSCRDRRVAGVLCS